MARRVVPFARDDEIVRVGDWAWAAVNFVVVLVVTVLLLDVAWRHLFPGQRPSGFLSLGIPVFLSSANAFLSFRLRLRRRRESVERKHAARLSAGLCPRCEYNLTGLIERRCPECGAGFDPQDVAGGDSRTGEEL